MPTVRELLDRAATELDSVARADTDPGVQLQCLLAVDRLELAGARPTVTLIDSDPALLDAALLRALAALGALPPADFATKQIREAAAAAHAARDELAT